MMKYRGGCHCGAVKFEAEATIDKLLACNCSICSKRGYLLTFVPEKDFTLLSGGDALTDYQFGKKHVHHLFCKNCGVGAFGKGAMPDGTEIRAVNARCIDDLDIATIPLEHFDGKNL
jgi:hypothetical protein